MLKEPDPPLLADTGEDDDVVITDALSEHTDKVDVVADGKTLDEAVPPKFDEDELLHDEEAAVERTDVIDADVTVGTESKLELDMDAVTNVDAEVNMYVEKDRDDGEEVPDRKSVLFDPVVLSLDNDWLVLDDVLADDVLADDVLPDDVLPAFEFTVVRSGTDVDG
ncbi:hypothetical protein LTR36_006908 [Oleoguttula mirabilis]|uniref:Uncharacterized protein n=1 Tax=Oleoguttula mirabilis TaxID=1507867 RepID=A0AAV9JAS8_9PEZI|nr:hypothetical protein LTR36_006908 [Oleoguttula mirabilis]